MQPLHAYHPLGAVEVVEVVQQARLLERKLSDLFSVDSEVSDRGSVANVQGLGSIPTVRLERKLGKVPNDVVTKLKAALAFALELG